MTADDRIDPADLFALFLTTLVQAITGTLSVQQEANGLLCRRLQRLGARFAAILAGAWRPCTRLRPAVAARHTPPQPPKANPNLPIGGFGAVLRQLTEYYLYRGQFEYLLARAEMRALIEATPQLRRVLNPLCQMLRLKPLPPLNPKPRTPRAKPPTPPAESPAQSRPQPPPAPETSAQASTPAAPSHGRPAPPSLWTCIERDLKRRKTLIFKTKPAPTG